MTKSVAIVVAVNDEGVLNSNLARSPAVRSGAVQLICCRHARSASEAYLRGLDQTQADLIAFAHQDVYFPSSWLPRVISAAEQLDTQDSKWAFLAPYGVKPGGEHIGQVWSSGLGRLIGVKPRQPERVESFDELAFVLNRSAGVFFDPMLPSFHLYGTDAVQTAKKRGYTAYVADLPTVHNSRPVTSLSGGYTTAYHYMQKKWKRDLPLHTVVVPITEWGFALSKLNLRMLAKHGLSKSRPAASQLDAEQIAIQLGYANEEH